DASRVPAAVHEALRSPGQALPASTRDVMEAAFGHDFSQVRVHADSRAARAAQAVDADAFTLGNQIVFGAERWAPQTHGSSRLLAHDLVHVLQQSSRAGPAGERLDGLDLSHRHDPAEREAEAVAARFGDVEPARARQVRTPGIARQEAGRGDRPLAPVLTPADPRISKILEPVARKTRTDLHPRSQAP